WELEDVLTARGIALGPGDAVCVYSGREAWHAANPETPYGRPFGPALSRPGLHVSCLPFLRDHDVSLLAWDMLDHLPIGYEVAWAVHACLFAYGVALLDNALLEPLARACAEEGRDEVMLVVAPLTLLGGRGSPAHPPAGVRSGPWRRPASTAPGWGDPSSAARTIACSSGAAASSTTSGRPGASAWRCSARITRTRASPVSTTRGRGARPGWSPSSPARRCATSGRCRSTAWWPTCACRRIPSSPMATAMP